MKPQASQPDYLSLLPVLKKVHFKPNTSVERQVAAHVRELILKRKIPAHSRLPPIRELAKLWDTNYFTVQGAFSRLVGEGLIVQSPKKGSFVAPPRRALRRACLYHDHTLSAHWQQEFYSLLNISLYRLLSQRGIITVPFFDNRDDKKLHTAPSEVREMAKDGEVDAVIATSVLPQNTGWLQKLEVPVASLMFEMPYVETDYAELARLVVEEATRNQRKVIGVIDVVEDWHSKYRKPGLLRTELRRLADERGISVIYPQELQPSQFKWEQRGSLLCEQLLRARTPPDLIFVYPDMYVRSVATALIQNHVAVPRQVMLISHRNSESQIYLPFPMIWLTTQIEDFARGLLEQIDRQITGKPVTTLYVVPKEERTVPEPLARA